MNAGLIQTSTVQQGNAGDINIDVDRYNNFNRTNVSNKNWQHNADHRGAVPYKDKGVAQKYDRGSSSPGSQARDAYRGRGDGAQGSRASDTMSREVAPSARRIPISCLRCATRSEMTP